MHDWQIVHGDVRKNPVLIGASTVGVRVTRGDRQEFKSLPWFQLEHAKLNPLTKLIDDTIAAVSR